MAITKLNYIGTPKGGGAAHLKNAIVYIMNPNKTENDVWIGGNAGNVICQHYGMDTSEYSFAYIAGWSTDREVPELKASLDTIRSTAREMITEIDQQMSIIRNYRKEKQVQKTEKGNCLEQNGMDIQNKDRRTMEGKEVVGRGLSIR